MKKVIAFLSIALVLPLGVQAANIDSFNSSAWGENIGWIDFFNTEVSDSNLSGYAYSSNTGWISLNCLNENECDSEYGVVNNKEGDLSGYAWSENIGWIDFTGVSVDGTNGDFSGYAYSPNIGYISFNCINTETCEDIDFKVATSWRELVATTTATSTATTTVEEEGANTETRSSRGRSGGKKKITSAPQGEVLGAQITTGPEEDQPSSSYLDENRLSSIPQDLYLGMTHDNVRKLQQLLNKMGYILVESGPGSPGNETNYFGTLTQAALAKFQADNGVYPSLGYFGPKTKIVFALKGF